MLQSTVCTLFEGNYHFGLGALINSLCANQFKGTVWVGYRGELPPWATPVTLREEYHELNLDVCRVCFIKLTTKIHLTNYKAEFMLDIWNRWDRNADALFYFDPDIVVKCEWWFLEKWAKNGIALCQDINAAMPIDHPVRLSWLPLAQQNNKEVLRSSSVYYNAGFIGVRKEYRNTIEIYNQLIQSAISQGMSQSGIKSSTKPYGYLFSVDQDILNLTAMVTPDPLSTVGPDGMDFTPGGYLLSHAIGSDKPWNKRFIREALIGFAPRMVDKLYFQNAHSPIRLYSDTEYRKHLVNLRIASAIGRFIRRS